MLKTINDIKYSKQEAQRSTESPPSHPAPHPPPCHSLRRPDSPREAGCFWRASVPISTCLGSFVTGISSFILITKFLSPFTPAPHSPPPALLFFLQLYGPQGQSPCVSIPSPTQSESLQLAVWVSSDDVLPSPEQRITNVFTKLNKPAPEIGNLGFYTR